MEQGIFQNAHHVNFIDAESNPLSLESMISQNEDLSSRLKVLIRRFADLEKKHNEVLSINENLSRISTSHKDQILVWKEKENLWKQKILKLENQINYIKEKFPDFERLETKLQSYKKYHQKVQTVVKPYVKQLKLFIQNLHLQIQSLNTDHEKQRNEIYRLEHLVKLEKENYEQLVRQSDLEKSQLNEFFAQQVKDLSEQNQNLANRNNILETNMKHHDRLQAKLTDVENMNVALVRNKDSFEEQLRLEMADLRNSTHSLQQANMQLKLDLDDKNTRIVELQSELKMMDQKNSELENQLSSLRHQWQKQNETLEKLTEKNKTLERLNLDLSLRIK